jgi:hypothetical protein
MERGKVASIMCAITEKKDNTAFDDRALIGPGILTATSTC